ncbi:hypothetical protein [Chryseobacterium sp.]|uniref:hypothetical protein n=1 Tax=Chryseobacterium sp. TaxID=1871047 RepID=UPI00289DE4D6|nr:hypothetical protein [Chryseobacterium sp.]
MLDNHQDFKSLVDTVKSIAVADNDENLLSILSRSEISIEQTSYDNWNGGIYFYTVYLRLDVQRFIEIKSDIPIWEELLEKSFVLPIRHLENEAISKITILPKSNLVSAPELNPHRPLSLAEQKRQDLLIGYLAGISEDELTEEVLMPLFRQLGFHKISFAGHKDKALEYGKDLWMKYTLPTQHILYFGIQVKKGKLDASGVSKGSNTNVAEIYNQVSMMLGHEIFDPEIGKRVLVDHAFIVAGGEITKSARNWLGGKLDASKRSQVMFMDRSDILNLFIVNSVPLPKGAVEQETAGQDDNLPF